MNTIHEHHGRSGQPAIAYRQLLAVIADHVPSDHLPWVELATVAMLQRARPWSRDERLTSVLATHDVGVATRAAAMINEQHSTAQVALGPPGRSSAIRFDVLVATCHRGSVENWLRSLWDAALRGLRQSPAKDRVAVARAMLRSAVLTSSSNQRRRQIRINTPDTLTLGALIEAGAALDIRIQGHWRRGPMLATVDSPADATQLLEAVGAGPIAERWTLTG